MFRQRACQIHLGFNFCLLLLITFFCSSTAVDKVNVVLRHHSNSFIIGIIDIILRLSTKPNISFSFNLSSTINIKLKCFLHFISHRRRAMLGKNIWTKRNRACRHKTFGAFFQFRFELIHITKSILGNIALRILQ